MKNFAKSVLNYFAAFNETRFRFSRRLPYEWSNDSYTLDLSVFPDFQKKLLDCVAAGASFDFGVEKGQYAVSLEHNVVRSAMMAFLETELGDDALTGLVGAALTRLKEALPDDDPDSLEKQAIVDGLREYNLALRHGLQNVLISLQEDKIADLRQKLGFTSVPPSSLNIQREVQRLYDEFQRFARNRTVLEGYTESIKAHLAEQECLFVVFDLHLVLQSYLQLVGAQTVYVFFHEILKGDQKYPLFTVEMEVADGDRVIRVKAARDVVMLNTPAINSFEFDTVLTTPRATRFTDCAANLGHIERFLQAKYSVSESFVMAGLYQPLVGKDLPTVRYRLGLQAVKEEDRQILDYSELITSLEEGGGRKFMDLVSRYIDGNVENTADNVDRQYRERYPRGSAERLVPRHSCIPLSLNETQKRILTAVENPKNEIIVVDGPPGTGKSYTITAIVYLAEQLGKSIVITSHKKQALDVIDDFLTEQFRSLHPRAKPSVLRLEKGKGPVSVNNLQNTLSSQVVNSARRRNQELNTDAVSADRDRVREHIVEAHDGFRQTGEAYDTNLRTTFEWVREIEALLGPSGLSSEAIPKKLPPTITFDVSQIRKVATQLQSNALTVSVDCLVAMGNAKEDLPNVLVKCEELNHLSSVLPPDLMSSTQHVPDGVAGLLSFLTDLASRIDPRTPIRKCDLDSAQIQFPQTEACNLFSIFADMLAVKTILSDLASNGGLLGKILRGRQIKELNNQLVEKSHEVASWVDQVGVRIALAEVAAAIDAIDAVRQEYPFLSADYILNGYRECPPSDLALQLKKLSSLEFKPIVDLLESIAGMDMPDMCLDDLTRRSEQLLSLKQYLDLRHVVNEFAIQVGVSVDDLSALFGSLKAVHKFLQATEDKDIQMLDELFKWFGPLLKMIGIVGNNLSSLGKVIANADIGEHLLRFITLHLQLSAVPAVLPPSRQDLTDYFEKTRKLLGAQTDERFSNLLNFSADVQRIQTAIAAGKRISPEQASVLLCNLSCIITEPSLISRHFPMQPDMIDLLVIDEASQVSIAESISLMLRAKQTIVLGDELQYGAVGAVNVSQRYSEYYFKDILHDFAKDRNVAMSDEETNRIASEASETPDEDDEASSSFIPVDPGTREWLKTFSVRTSTLAFAKALQNYSASLNVHFRSFPEIISYSNDFFYKESQIELITNRIRTKPIGEVLRFIKVETKGMSGRNVNLDEIEAIQRDIEQHVNDGYKGTMGVICSFKEQAIRMEELLRKEMSLYPDLTRNHRFKIWFVGDVQGEERDLIYYTFVQDKKHDNADLRMIYPTIGGSADNIRKLKMQRLNVGFSRAKDIMVFVHSMPIGDYSDSRLGDALRHYDNMLNSAHDHYVEGERVFGSPAEKELYSLILQTPYFQANKDQLRLIAQFEIGKYIRQEFHRNIPQYRVDFLLTKTDGGKEKSLIIEYDGVEYHTKNPDIVTAHNFGQEYLEYDIERQLELETYGYSFLRINKFSLVPTEQLPTRLAVLDDLLKEALSCQA